MATVCAQSTFDQLFSVASPILKHYRDDLEKHDKQAIEDNPNSKFIHYCSDSSTHILLLLPIGDYPKDGVQVPYLFGHADRWHLLAEVKTMASYFTQSTNNPERYTVHYFDGKTLTKINAVKAMDIAGTYYRNVKAQWDHDRSQWR